MTREFHLTMMTIETWNKSFLQHNNMDSKNKFWWLILTYVIVKRLVSQHRGLVVSFQIAVKKMLEYVLWIFSLFIILFLEAKNKVSFTDYKRNFVSSFLLQTPCAIGYK